MEMARAVVLARYAPLDFQHAIACIIIVIVTLCFAPCVLIFLCAHFRFISWFARGFHGDCWMQNVAAL